VPEPEPEPAAPLAPAPDVTATLEAIVAAAPAPVTLSPLAVARAVRPDGRPRNFDQVVARALGRGQSQAQDAAIAAAQPPAAQQPPAQQAAPAAPQVVAPTGPVPGGVARAATMQDVMNLREINLIGVFGRPNDRRALVRMANGRLQRVGVGDTLDGGQVVAITDNSLNYVKRGRTITIAIPQG